MDTNFRELIFFLDMSGSMKGLEADTISGFNSFIEKQRNSDGKTIVTAVLFDDKYQIKCEGVNAEKLQLTEMDYYIRGTTALFDAVGKTIIDVDHRLLKTSDEKRPGKVIFVISTFCMKDLSREFTYEKIKELIINQQERYNWTFIFLGANIDVTKEAGSIGIPETNAYCFDMSKAGVEKMYNTVSDAIYKKCSNN